MASLTSDQIPISSYSIATTALYQNVLIHGEEYHTAKTFRAIRDNCTLKNSKWANIVHKMHPLHMAIRWSDEPARLAQVRRSAAAHVHGRPLHLAVGSSVAIVQKGGAVRCIFECAGIDGPISVTLADGSKKNNGFIVRARPESIRSPRADEPLILRCRWYAVGQFRYLDENWKPTFVTESRGGSSYLVDDDNAGMRPYTGGIPGMDRSAPEAVLVDQYVQWMSASRRWGQRFLPSDHLYCDLFDRTFWRLIEAKAALDRRTLRTAVGQLLDYRRCFDRRPSLGVLLPGRPTHSDVAFLSSCKITAIWRTASGRFSDSTPDRRWSTRTE